MGSSTLQGELWSAAARDWADLQEPTHKPLWDAMLEEADVGAGTRLLDAGCGAGGACILASGRGARVSGIDAAQALIDIAGDRLPGGDFRVGDLEELPYGEDAFDVVIASLSVMYASDPVTALRELRRVCAPGGRVFVATWGAPEDCDQRVVFEAVRSTVPDPPKGGGPFALSAPGALEGFVGQAGLKPVGTRDVLCPYVYPDDETCWRGQRAGGPVQGAMRVVPEERLKEAVLKACRPYKSATGEYRFQNTLRYVTATP